MLGWAQVTADVAQQPHCEPLNELVADMDKIDLRKLSFKVLVDQRQVSNKLPQKTLFYILVGSLQTSGNVSS